MYIGDDCEVIYAEIDAKHAQCHAILFQTEVHETAKYMCVYGVGCCSATSYMYIESVLYSH